MSVLSETILAYRAAIAFLHAAHWDTGFDVRITKHIPAGSGLGGGSADAAATLRALNALAPTPLSTATLLDVAAQLGADVPFLTSDAAMALAWGRGERFLSLDALPQRTIALVVPPFRIATAEAYGWIAAERLRHEPESCVSRATELRYWHIANWDELHPWAVNDFEPIIADRFPIVDNVIATLRDAGAAFAGVTGSGSAIFGVFHASPPNLGDLTDRIGLPALLTRTAGGVEAVHQID